MSPQDALFAVTVEPGDAAASIDAAISSLDEKNALARMVDRDHTLWQDDPTEVADRLGWLSSPAAMAATATAGAIDALADEVTAAGFTRVVVSGMGGSSLFPEVMAQSFGSVALPLIALDTTNPSAIAGIEASPDWPTTLFVIASKSGTTVETRSQFDRFWSLVDDPGRFVAITDPGSELADIAQERHFRRLFENPPDIGGRYATLSYFGLVPAALVTPEWRGLLRGAADVVGALDAADSPDAAHAVRLAGAIAGAANGGRDKLTIVLPDSISSFGLWLEQLIAESLGKSGVGVVPVVGEALGEASVYGDDRTFVIVGGASTRRRDEGPAEDDVFTTLQAAGHPVLRVGWGGGTDGLGQQVVLWEAATALAGAVLGINPFDQPNVAEAKAKTNEVLAEAEAGDGIELPAPTPLASALEQAEAGSYLAVLAYVDGTDPVVVGQLERACAAIRDERGIAVTLGLGPRYLHSTGQLHKGGPETGVFVVVVDERDLDLPIPDQGHGFRRLFLAQAVGDLHTLHDHGLPVFRVDYDELTARAG